MAQTGRRKRSVAVVLLAALLSTLLTACSGWHGPLPPDSAPPEVVLDAYLKALVAGDCATARALGTASFGDGFLCGGLVRVVAFEEPTVTEAYDTGVAYTVVLTTRGSDVTVPDGAHPWRIAVVREQGDGPWRVGSAGNGS